MCSRLCERWSRSHCVIYWDVQQIFLFLFCFWIWDVQQYYVGFCWMCCCSCCCCFLHLFSFFFVVEKNRKQRWLLAFKKTNQTTKEVQRERCLMCRRQSNARDCPHTLPLKQRQTNRQTYRRTDRQTNRQTDVKHEQDQALRWMSLLKIEMKYFLSQFPNSMFCKAGGISTRSSKVPFKIHV